MAVAAILNSKNFNFWSHDCNDFQNGGRPPSWICYDVTVLHRRTHFRCPNIVLKFLVNRCCSFRDICNIIRQPFGPFFPVDQKSVDLFSTCGRFFRGHFFRGPSYRRPESIDSGKFFSVNYGLYNLQSHGYKLYKDRSHLHIRKFFS